jgi:hypothetical protein
MLKSVEYYGTIFTDPGHAQALKKYRKICVFAMSPHPV